MIRRIRGWLVVFIAGMTVSVSGCGPTKVVSTDVFVDRAPEVSAMAVSADGQFAYASRATGDVFVRSPAAATSTLVAHVDVSSEGQRGLLGLAYGASNRLFASFTASTGERRIVIEQIAPGAPAVVWNGPPSADLANGGHIAFGPDGKLVVGIGDLLDASKLNDPNAPNGKLLSLDVNADSDQRPAVVSSGWHNPFAFAFRNDGSLFVGDNEPGDDSERLARADKDGKPTQIAFIGSHKVASGLASTADGSLWECTYLGKTLQQYKLDGSGVPVASGKPIATDCSLGVVALADGRLAYSTEQQIRVVDPEQ